MYSQNVLCHSVAHAGSQRAQGPVAQWIRHRPTEPGVAGPSPAGVICMMRHAMRRALRYAREAALGFGFLAQRDNWYDSNWSLACHIYFSMGAVSSRACSEALMCCTGLAHCQAQHTLLGNNFEAARASHLHNPVLPGRLPWGKPSAQASCSKPAGGQKLFTLLDLCV